MRHLTRNISIVLLILLSVLIPSCQSNAEEIVIDTPVQIEVPETPVAVEEQEPPVAEEPEEVPVSVTYSYMEYELTIDAYDGYADIYYPSGIAEDDVSAFLQNEALKHQIDNVTYTIAEDGILHLYYPQGVSVEDRKAFSDLLANDLIIHVSSHLAAVPETVVVSEYTYGGYTLTAEMMDGKTVISYPSVVTDEDAEAFFAFVNSKYGFASLGVRYALPEAGKAVITYPDEYTSDVVSQELEILINDLIAYMTEVPVAVQKAEHEKIVINEVYTYGGYTLEATIEEGQTTLVYPAVSNEEAEAFIAIENEKYGYGDMGVSYVIEEPGLAVFTYPDSILPSTVSVELDNLISDLIAYISPAPEVVSVSLPEEEPVVKTYSYGGYTVEAVIESGKTTLTYPPVSNSEAEAFIALENERYGFSAMGVVYEIEDEGKAVFTYPESISGDVVAAELDLLIDDLIEYVTTPVAEESPVSLPEPEEEPVVKTYSYGGYTVEAVIESGKTTLTYPPVSNSEAEAFIALENERYGFGAMGVVYEIEDEGKAVFTYPESISEDVVAGELDLLIGDLIEYVTTPVAEEAPALEPEPVIETVVAEERVEYPFGVEPIVKAEGDTDGFYLYIGHTNDVHGRIVSGEDGSMGYAKLGTLVDMAKSMSDDILLLDGGDTLHGTNLANMFEGQTVLEIMADVGYDAMTPGNHDFNYGFERLEEAAAWAEDNSSFRILSANISDENGYLLFQPYQIYDFNGFLVSVVGITTPDTKTKSHPDNTEGVEFLSDAVVENAQAAIDLMHELSDFVIVLGHIGVVPDGESGLTSEIIAENIDGIDLFIDAHSHTVMDGGDMVNGTLIVSTGQYLNNLGIVEVCVDADGEATIEDAYLLPASEVLDPSTGTLLNSLGVTEVKDDPEIISYIEAKQDELEDILGEVVAELPMDLNGERSAVRTGKTNLSSLICAAMTNESGADFTITNGGGIRASLKAGPVTLGDINNVLPFTNIITVCEITPKDVYAALEHGYSLLPEENGAFSQTDLRVVYSASAPAGERIKKVYLGNVLLDRNDDETLYKVASNDFMAAGGDGYTMFGRVLTEGGLLNEVFADYLAKLYPAD